MISRFYDSHKLCTGLKSGQYNNFKTNMFHQSVAGIQDWSPNFQVSTNTRRGCGKTEIHNLYQVWIRLIIFPTLFACTADHHLATSVPEASPQEPKQRMWNYETTTVTTDLVADVCIFSPDQIMISLLVGGLLRSWTTAVSPVPSDLRFTEWWWKSTQKMLAWKLGALKTLAFCNSNLVCLGIYLLTWRCSCQ